MVGCSKQIDEKNLVNRDGIKYIENKETPFNGKTVSTYDNNQKELEGFYKNGKKDGHFTYWFENGQKMQQGNYQAGKLDGLWIFWDREGKEIDRATYKDGKLVGT